MGNPSRLYFVHVKNYSCRKIAVNWSLGDKDRGEKVELVITSSIRPLY